MSEATSARRTSRITTWISAIAGLLLLYFLSIPWAVTFTNWHPSLGGAWVRSYEAPLYFVLRHSPQGVRHLISQYDAWCRGMMNYQPPKHAHALPRPMMRSRDSLSG